jgi:hypothetical protein
MRPIKNCFNKQIANICNRVIELEALNAKLITLLPEELRAACQVGSFNKGLLILITADSSWATQLRFIKSDLRDKFRKEAGLHQLTAIDIKIMDSPEKFTPKKVKIKTISKQAQQTLKFIINKLGSVDNSFLD